MSSCRRRSLDEFAMCRQAQGWTGVCSDTSYIASRPGPVMTLSKNLEELSAEVYEMSICLSELCTVAKAINQGLHWLAVHLPRSSR